MEQIKKKSFYYRIDFWLGLLISALCIAWVVTRIDFDELARQLRSANLKYILLAMLTMFSGYCLRAYRWNFFFEKKSLSFFKAFKCLIVGFFMNNTLPARMGELVRARAGSLATGQSTTTVLASIASERLTDGITISLYFIVLFGIWAKPQDLAEHNGLYYVTYFFVAVAAFTITTLIFRYKIFQLLEQINQRLKHQFFTFALQRIKVFIEGLEPLFMLRNIFVSVPLSIIIWGLELSVYGLVTLGFGQELGIMGLVLFMTVVNFSSLIPAAPAGVGVIEAATTLALTGIGVNPTLALSMVLTQHVLQMIVVGIPGGMFFFSVMQKDCFLCKNTRQKNKLEER
ncbi:MAG: flippase-like domain-containing protein [Deltaproteobacteria bacterium]|jgi:uncharacterized protein (TIRG00374 family)|nr:flippase-like domain-containing protein [Deltaproteobacteria bacterium]